MKTRNILKSLTVGLMILIGLTAMIAPSMVTEFGVMLFGFLFLILGLRSVFYTLESNDEFWYTIDRIIKKKLIKKIRKDRKDI